MLVVGVGLGVGCVYVWTLFNKPAYEFGRPEAHYLADLGSINILVPYTYNGGCEIIQWSHTASILDKTYNLAAYDGPPRFTDIGPGVYTNTVKLPEPLEPGMYDWRGQMICTDVDGRQSQHMTPFVRLMIPKSGGPGPHRLPMDWQSHAIPKCCSSKVL